MKNFFSIIACLFICSVCNAGLVDSLQIRLKGDISDSIRAMTYNTLAKNFSRTDPDKSIRYADSSIYFGTLAEFELELGKSLMHKAIACNYKQEYDQSMEYSYEAMAIFKRIDDQGLIGGCHINIGVSLWRNNQLDEAKSHYKEALVIMSSENDLHGMASINSNLGILNAIDSNYVKAKMFFETALEQYIELEDLSSQARMISNIGAVYNLTGDFTKALEYNDLSLELNEDLKDDYGIINSLKERAEIYKTTKDYLKAIKTLERAAIIASRTVYLEHKIDIELARSEVFELMGNYSSALVHFKSYTSYRDSMTNSETQSKIADLESVYENEQNKKEIKLLNQTAEIDKIKLSEKDAKIEKDKIQKYGLISGLVLVLIIAGISIYSFVQKKKSELIIARQKEEVEAQKLEIEEKHLEITDSINYAEKIQTALLGNNDVWQEIGSDRFIYFKPKDVVSGDFHWCSAMLDQNKLAWVAADCTGHGVPGAMMSMLGIGLLNEIVSDPQHQNPSSILKQLRQKIINSLANKNDQNQRKDGMDMMLCVLDKQSNVLTFSGANNPLWIISKRSEIELESKVLKAQNGELFLHEIKSSKQPVGLYTSDLKDYAEYKIKLEPGELIYSFSDGYPDQFGGEKGKKFKYTNFKHVLLDNADESMDKQLEILSKGFEDWMGDFDQIDDVIVTGVRI